MGSPDITAPGRFCWVDLAATSAGEAQAFYAALFNWQALEQCANGGTFTRLVSGGADVGSLYQMQRQHIEAGMRSHWTPYVRVASADETAGRVTVLGGELLVKPFDAGRMARIALVTDNVGAAFGLWEPLHGA